MNDFHVVFAGELAKFPRGRNIKRFSERQSENVAGGQFLKFRKERRIRRRSSKDFVAAAHQTIRQIGEVTFASSEMAR
jgi:hypothetical protein